MDSPKENAPDGKGRYFHLNNNQNPEHGFPAGRIHQVERAGIFHINKIKTLNMDSPQGEYTHGKGWHFPSKKSQNPENGFPEGRMHQMERACIFTI